jgi:hypothetical protein
MPSDYSILYHEPVNTLEQYLLRPGSAIASVHHAGKVIKRFGCIWYKYVAKIVKWRIRAILLTSRTELKKKMVELPSTSLRIVKRQSVGEYRSHSRPRQDFLIIMKDGIHKDAVSK